MREPVTLSELALSVKSVVYLSYPESLWVTAEISELNINKSGHCYLELIEKEIIGDRIIARMRATIWLTVFRNIRPFFQSTTGFNLKAGIKVMLLVQPEFHEVYGLSLNVRDIDPSYTLGDIARRKQEVLKKLKEEGVIDMNKSLALPIVPQRIAVISSETAAGYGDFIDSLIKNVYGFYFDIHLFPSIMQGEKSESSIINSLEKIYRVIHNFDVVVMIRGGGAQSELDIFNSYELAFHMCQFPIPLITGIGHERDETIADYVAHTSLKTPTAVAEFLISAFLTFENRMEISLERISTEAQNSLSEKNNLLEKKSYELNLICDTNLNSKRNALTSMEAVLPRACYQYLSLKQKDFVRTVKLIEIQSYSLIKEMRGIIHNYFLQTGKNVTLFVQKNKQRINNLEKNIDHLNPDRILERGFTITSLNGKIIKSYTMVRKNDSVSTLFRDGVMISKVESLKKKNKP